MAELIYPVGGAFQLPASVKYTPITPNDAEPLPVVNEYGEVTAWAQRGFIHQSGNILHPVVHLHIINRTGDIYLQKRSMTKDLLPGYWDTAVGGHIGYGETAFEALVREAKEELGLDEFNPIFVSNYINETRIERELVYAYAIVGNFQPCPDGIEVEQGAYWSEKKIDDNFGKGVLTPNFEFEFSRIRAALKALL